MSNLEAVSEIQKIKHSNKVTKIENKIESILDGDTPTQIVDKVLESYPEQKENLENLNSYKDEYSKKGMLGKWWNKGEMQEKTNDAVFLLTKMSDSQLKLQVLLVWMTNELKKQQDIIVYQQSKLKQQSDVLSQNQDTLKNQHEQLEKQTEILEQQGNSLAEQAEKLHRENEELIQRAAELRELREIGKEHDEAIDEHDNALSGMERFLIELKQVVAEYREDKKILEDHKQAINDLQENTDKHIDAISLLKASVEKHDALCFELKDNLIKINNDQAESIKSIRFHIDEKTNNLHGECLELSAKLEKAQETCKQLQNEQSVFCSNSEAKISQCLTQSAKIAGLEIKQKKIFISLLIWLIVLSITLGAFAVFALLK